MARLLLRRLLTSVFLLWIVLTATFVVVQVAPGDPTDLILRPGIAPEQARRLEAIYGLDRPLHEQYGSWLSAFVRADLGQSFLHVRPVTTVIAEVWVWTLQLALAAFSIQMAAGGAIGVVSALWRDRPSDHLLRFLAIVLYSTPTFWLGLMAILVVSVRLGWLPSSGVASPLAASWTGAQQLADRLAHLVLPAMTLGLPLAAYTARILRGQLAIALEASYSQAARARGLPERTVVRHALRNALPALIQVAGVTLPALLGGSVITEAVFNRPGLGDTTMTAIQSRDFPLLLGVVTSGALAVVLGNLGADVALLAADPRLRDARAAPIPP